MIIIHNMQNSNNVMPVVADNEKAIRVDRSTPLGNPFIMYSERERDEVCNDYVEYFDTMVANREKNHEFIVALTEIFSAANRYDNVYLCCWCAPKRCHAETIKNYVERCLYDASSYGKTGKSPEA